VPGSQALEPYHYQADTAESGLCTWLAEHALLLKDSLIEVELASTFSTLFCLPFSPAMDSPASVLRIAEGYATNALGKSAPTQFRVAEPLMYGCSPLIVALHTSTGFVSPTTPAIDSVHSVQAYGLSAWNRYAQQLPVHPCWLAVIEPAALSLFYSHGRTIVDVLSMSLPGVSPDYCAAVKQAIQRQFHRPYGELFCIDEFGLIGDTAVDGLELLAVQGYPVEPRSLEASA
jgi:hypothetical protein